MFSVFANFYKVISDNNFWTLEKLKIRMSKNFSINQNVCPRNNCIIMNKTYNIIMIAFPNNFIFRCVNAFLPGASRYPLERRRT